MAMDDSDLKVFLALTNNDTTANGGAMSQVEANTGQSGQVWPAVFKAERDAGSVKYRKLFHKNDNADDIVLQNGRVLLLKPTLGDGAIYLFPATHTDTQADITGSEALFGAGTLDVAAIATGTSISVAVEDGAVIIYRNAGLVYIYELDENGALVAEEFATISGTPSVLGDIVTITLSAGLINPYAVTGGHTTYVCSVIAHGNVAPATTTPVVTSAGGAYAAAGLEGHNLGTDRQSWTLTFTSSTAFNVVGSVAGSVGAGNRSTDFSPTNPATGTPYFTLLATGFSGTFATGNTITFTTSPAAAPVWQKRVIPAGAVASSGNSADSRLWGEAD